MILISQFKIQQDIDQATLFKCVLAKNHIQENDVIKITIKSKSIDARKKDNIYYVYSFLIEVKDENKYPHLAKEKPLEQLKINIKRKSVYQPVIIGAGPSGLFAGLTLVDNGVKPIIVEQGQPVEQRIIDVDKLKTERIINTRSNIQFGEGGAGTFSDGKLNTGINSPLIKAVLETFVKFGASQEITYLAKPHVGTDKLVDIVSNIRKYIINNGGSYHFDTKFIDYEIENNLIKVICDKQVFTTDCLILAIGHSSRDTYQLLKDKKMEMKQKDFSVGLRIEHLQKDINNAQYGKQNKLKLPAADYKLVYHASNGRVCYSFCNCPGGQVMASNSDEKSIVTNGMSNSARDGINCNSALLVNVLTSDLASDDIMAGVNFQKELEEKAFVLGGNNYNAPITLLKDYLENKPSKSLGEIKPTYLPGTTLSNIAEILPTYVNETIREAIPYFDKKIKGFNNPDAILTAVETRTSSPLTIIRNDNMESSIKHIYVIGEGAGHAGGITSSCVDGIKVALKILERED